MINRPKESVDLQNQEDENEKDKESENDEETDEEETDGTIQAVGCPTHRVLCDEWDSTFSAKQMAP
jgi:hypothetical protein